MPRQPSTWRKTGGWVFPPNDGPRAIYYDAVRNYAKWTTARDLASKRLRMTIRFIALEERCEEVGLHPLPKHVMDALRVLSDYQEAQKPEAYTKRRGRPEKVRNPYDHIKTMDQVDLT